MGSKFIVESIINKYDKEFNFLDMSLNELFTYIGKSRSLKDKNQVNESNSANNVNLILNSCL